MSSPWGPGARHNSNGNPEFVFLPPGRRQVPGAHSHPLALLLTTPVMPGSQTSHWSSLSGFRKLEGLSQKTLHAPSSVPALPSNVRYCAKRLGQFQVE